MALSIPVFTFNKDAFIEYINTMNKNSNVNKILEYNMVYNESLKDKTYIDNYLKKIFDNFQYENSKKIFIPNADINYIMEMILHIENKYFNKVLETLNIDTISNISSYGSNSNYLKYKKMYLEIMYKNIFENENKNLLILLDKHWDNLKFQNLIDFTTILIKLNDNNIDIDKFNSYISSKLNVPETLKKIIIIFREMYTIDKNSKTFYLKMKYIINNLMTDGLLLFQEFEKDIINYSTKNLLNLRKCEIDIGLITMFINIIQNKDKTASSRNVNEILLRIKSILTDIKNNCLDNDAYTKINIAVQSDKYKD